MKTLNMPAAVHREYRLAYQRLYRQLREKFWTDPEAGDDFYVYLNKHVAKLRAEFMTKERGPYKDHSTFTDRQRYQADYQKARRKAQAAWWSMPEMRAQYKHDFAEYWKATRKQWLPLNFLKEDRPNRERAKALDTLTPPKPTKWQEKERRFDEYMAQATAPRPKPVSVHLDTDPIEDNDGWFTPEGIRTPCQQAHP